MPRARRVILVLASFLIVIHGAALLLASDSVTGTQGVAQNVTGPDGVRKKITNSSPTGLTEYIPTTSVAEWQSFVAHPPAGVTLASRATNITVPAGTNLISVRSQGIRASQARTRSRSIAAASSARTTRTHLHSQQEIAG